MNSKVFYLVFILSIKFDVISGQNEFVSCRYHTNSYGGYVCELFINNPNGLNNFLTISGTHLPGFSDSNIVSISRNSSSNTLNVPSIICQRFSSITSFDLNFYGIQRIDDFSFNGCTLSLMISIAFNNIHTISDKAFSRNLALRFLYLQSNQISTLPENIFLNQLDLDTLFLYNNKINDLPRNIFKSTQKLKDLNLLGNQISNLRSEWFENLQSLQYLNLNYNYIADLPKNIFSQLKSLIKIELTNNNLKTIHADSFDILPTLRTADFGTNQIDAIDEKLIDNTGINRIDMSRNLCASKIITDSSTSRDYMRAELSLCFSNYESQMSICRQHSNPMLDVSSSKLTPEIFINQTEQIRKLENENKILRETNKILMDKNTCMEQAGI